MENASKALIMAAGILIAVLTITVIAVLRSTFVKYGQAYEESISTLNIQEFNTKFLQYENKELTIQDVMTIANLVKEWNNTGYSNEKISLYIEDVGNEDQMNYAKIAENNDDIKKSEEGNIVIKKYSINISEERYSSGRIKTIEIE